MNHKSIFGDELNFDHLLNNLWTPSSVHESSSPSASLNAGVAALKRIEHFLPVMQARHVRELMRGEEGSFFIDKMIELSKLIDNMPVTYKNREGDPLAFLHYFHGGSDWYIVEKDVDGGVMQAYGYACLNGDMMNAEYGYISIEELRPFPMMQLDFHFEPTPMSTLIDELRQSNGYGC